MTTKIVVYIKLNQVVQACMGIMTNSIYMPSKQSLMVDYDDLYVSMSHTDIGLSAIHVSKQYRHIFKVQYIQYCRI